MKTLRQIHLLGLLLVSIVAATPALAQDALQVEALAGAQLLINSPTGEQDAEVRNISATVSEYRLKMNLIKQFMGLTMWQDANKRSRMPFVIAILGENPFGKDLMAFEQLQYNGRRVEVQQLVDVGEIVKPDVLIISRADNETKAAALALVKKQSVLTILDEPNKNEGIINFIRQGNSIVFSINEAAAHEAGIILNPMLLKYAIRH